VQQVAGAGAGGTWHLAVGAWHLALGRGGGKGVWQETSASAAGHTTYKSVDRPKPGLVTLLATKDGEAVFGPLSMGGRQSRRRSTDCRCRAGLEWRTIWWLGTMVWYGMV